MRKVKPAAVQPMLHQLAVLWAAQLPDATPRQLVNVLWACGKLKSKDTQMWSSTLGAYMQQLQHGQQEVVASQGICNVLHGLANAASANRGAVPGVDRADVDEAVMQLVEHMLVFVAHPSQEGVVPQDISNTLWACAKLRINPGNSVLDGLLQGIARPRMRELIEPHHLSNTLWAVSDLQERGWQPRVAAQLWQQLLGEQALAKVAETGDPQHVSNVVLALARLRFAAAPVISKEFAQQCSQQLLQGQTVQQLRRWNAQDVGNAMWGCAKLGLCVESFCRGVDSTSAIWLQRAVAASLTQVSSACGTLQLQLPHLMTGVVKRAQQLFAQQGKRKAVGERVPEAGSARVPATCGYTLAVLDMQQLAGDVKALVAAGVKPSRRLKGEDARMLGMFHSWLMQQQLLDGQGLSGVLSAEQLKACEAAWSALRTSNER
ncbi:hypothetical protein COO60DRAFT_106911 [Scenedesmus sp. NREL 46B-D3]|nr:hypothetical protein COO60DRAFT_106911 [Scenedesmus sp. NREL 46B-D3]